MTSPSGSTTIGVAGFVLKYRLARTTGSKYKIEEHALEDAKRAVRLVRSRASEWGVDPQTVGMIGFSAGGEVTALAGTRFDPGSEGAADPIDRLELTPGLPRPRLSGVPPRDADSHQGNSADFPGRSPTMIA